MFLSISIRGAEPEDLDFILAELKHFSKFYATRLPLFGDEAYAREFVASLINKHVMFLAVRDDVKLGFISGMLTAHVYNPLIRVLMEAFWWVKEEYRGTRAGHKLLEAFLAFGKANADWIMFTLEDKSPVNDKILLKRGFRQIEKNYLLEV
jgi:hypothetical protein